MQEDLSNNRSQREENCPNEDSPSSPEETCQTEMEYNTENYLIDHDLLLHWVKLCEDNYKDIQTELNLIRRTGARIETLQKEHTVVYPLYRTEIKQLQEHRREIVQLAYQFPNCFTREGGAPIFLTRQQCLNKMYQCLQQRYSSAVRASNRYISQQSTTDINRRNFSSLHDSALYARFYQQIIETKFRKLGKKLCHFVPDLFAFDKRSTKPPVVKILIGGRAFIFKGKEGIQLLDRIKEETSALNRTENRPKLRQDLSLLMRSNKQCNKDRNVLRNTYVISVSALPVNPDNDFQPIEDFSNPATTMAIDCDNTEIQTNQKKPGPVYNHVSSFSTSDGPQLFEHKDEELPVPINNDGKKGKVQQDETQIEDDNMLHLASSASPTFPLPPLLRHKPADSVSTINKIQTENKVRINLDDIERNESEHASTDIPTPLPSLLGGTFKGTIHHTNEIHPEYNNKDPSGLPCSSPQYQITVRSGDSEKLGDSVPIIHENKTKKTALEGHSVLSPAFAPTEETRLHYVYVAPVSNQQSTNKDDTTRENVLLPVSRHVLGQSCDKYGDFAHLAHAHKNDAEKETENEGLNKRIAMHGPTDSRKRLTPLPKISSTHSHKNVDDIQCMIEGHAITRRPCSGPDVILSRHSPLPPKVALELPPIINQRQAAATSHKKYSEFDLETKYTEKKNGSQKRPNSPMKGHKIYRTPHHVDIPYIGQDVKNKQEKTLPLPPIKDKSRNKKTQ